MQGQKQERKQERKYHVRLVGVARVERQLGQRRRCERLQPPEAQHTLKHLRPVPDRIADAALQVARAHPELGGDRAHSRPRPSKRQQAAQTSGSGSPTPRRSTARKSSACGSWPAANASSNAEATSRPRMSAASGERSQSSDAGSPKTAPAVAGRSRNPTSREPGARATNRTVVSGPAIASRSPPRSDRRTHPARYAARAPSPWPAPTCRPQPGRPPDARRNPQSQSYPTGRDRWATALG